MGLFLKPEWKSDYDSSTQEIEIYDASVGAPTSSNSPTLLRAGSVNLVATPNTTDTKIQYIEQKLEFTCIYDSNIGTNFEEQIGRAAGSMFCRVGTGSTDPTFIAPQSKITSFQYSPHDKPAVKFSFIDIISAVGRKSFTDSLSFTNTGGYIAISDILYTIIKSTWSTYATTTLPSTIDIIDLSCIWRGVSAVSILDYLHVSYATEAQNINEKTLLTNLMEAMNCYVVQRGNQFYVISNNFPTYRSSSRFITLSYNTTTDTMTPTIPGSGPATTEYNTNSLTSLYTTAGYSARDFIKYSNKQVTLQDAAIVSNGSGGIARGLDYAITNDYVNQSGDTFGGLVSSIGTVQTTLSWNGTGTTDMAQKCIDIEYGGESDYSSFLASWSGYYVPDGLWLEYWRPHDWSPGGYKAGMPISWRQNLINHSLSFTYITEWDETNTYST